MKNIFVYDKRITLAFTDRNATLSGRLMKEIEYRQPEVIKQLYKLKPLLTGGFYRIKDFVFFVSKNDYRNKLDEEQFKKDIIKYLDTFSDETRFKTYLKDIKIENINHEKLVVYDRCDWAPSEPYERM